MISSFSIFVLFKHLITNLVFHISDDTNSNISKDDTMTMAGLFSGVGVFVIFIMIFLIKHKFTSTDSQPTRSVPEPSYDSQNVSNSENKNLFITPVAYNNDEHIQEENDVLI